METKDPELSIVIPVYHEEDALRGSYDAISKALASLDMSYEIVFVDDGSRDRSFDIIRELHERDPRVVGVRFSRNFGHQAAVTAGYERARGRAVLCMDADLQHPPELIPEFVRLWREGHQVVIGVKKEENASLFRKLSTGIAYRVINAISEVEIPAHAPDFRLLDRSALDALLALPERERLLRGMVSWIGFRRAEVEVEIAPRVAGSSSYSLAKLVKLAMDGAFSFSVAPLRLSLGLGLAMSLSGFGYMAWALFVRIFGTVSTPPGWTSILAALLLIGGMQLMVLGVVGEYIGRIYNETKRRPLYLVESSVGAEPPKASASPTPEV